MSNDLIKIEITDSGEQAVSVRELYEKLGIQKHFTQWWEYQVGKLNLTEGLDFLTIMLESTGGRPSVDYIVPLDIGKHICMVSGGEKAHQLREYFIKVEKAWNSPEAVMARALIMADKRLAEYQNQITELLPKAESFDHFMSAKNAQTMGEVAKALGIGRNLLFQFLRDNAILNRNNVPYQSYIDRGYFEVIEKPIVIGGETFNKPQTYCTPKGVDWIAKLLKKGGEANVPT
jgi:anti-repressor protein